MCASKRELYSIRRPFFASKHCRRGEKIKRERESVRFVSLVMSREEGGGAEQKKTMPKLSFKFKLGGGGGGAATTTTTTTTSGKNESNPSNVTNTKQKKRDFDAVNAATFDDAAGARATKRQKNDDDDLTDAEKQLQAKIDALERQQQQFQQQKQQQQTRGGPPAQPRAAAAPKTGRGKELRGMGMTGMLPSNGPASSSPTTTTTTTATPGNVSGSIDDSDRLELSRLASARSATPGANNKTQKKGTKKSGGAGNANGRKNKREQTPPSGLVSAFNIFDDIGDINFPSPPSGGSNLADDILFGSGGGSAQQHNNLPPSSLKPSPFIGGGGGKPAAMLARLEREQEMGKKKGAGKSSGVSADIAAQQPQRMNQPLPFPSVPSSKNLSAGTGGGGSGDLKESDLPPPKKGQMEEIIKQLQKLDKQKIFLNPVTEAIAPGYFQMIDRPMDISTIRANLKEKKYYTSWSMFEEDLRLMYTNCQDYNGPNSPYFEIAQQGLKEMRNLMHEKILESLTKKKGFTGTFQMSSMFPSLDDLGGDSSKQQSELASEGGGDYSRDNSDDENDEKMKRETFQKKKNRDTFKPYNVFGKSAIDREPFEKRCPTMQSHCDNQLLQAYRYDNNGSSFLVNYSNHIASMKEKPYEVFPPLARNVSFVAYVKSIKAFAGELLPLEAEEREEEETAEGEEEKDKDDKKMQTRKIRKHAFVARWVKERTEGCDAWRDLMYIPEPPRVQVMQKVAQQQAAVPATSNVAAGGGAPKLSAAAAAAAAAEQSHARALAAAKSQQRILAPPVVPPPATLKRSDSLAKSTSSAQAARRAQGSPGLFVFRQALELVTEDAKKSLFEARKRWQLAGAALKGQVSEDVLKTDPLEKLAGSSITVSEIVSMLPNNLTSRRMDMESSDMQYNGSTLSLSMETSSPPTKEEPGQRKSLRDIVQGLSREYQGALQKFGL